MWNDNESGVVHEIILAGVKSHLSVEQNCTQGNTEGQVLNIYTLSSV